MRLLLLTALLLPGCALVEPGPDGGPSPLEAAKDAAASTVASDPTAVREAAEGDTDTLWYVLGAAGLAAVTAGYRAYRKNARARS